MEKVKLPIGTVRIRERKRRRLPGPNGGASGGGSYSVRFIKVRDSGPKGRHWIPFAKWWWETNRGSVPAGMRVCHLDGNSLNDDPSNFGLLSAADVVYLAHERDPKMSRDNYRKVAAATAEANRLRGRVFRATKWLKHNWYPVDFEKQIIINIPFRKRVGLLRYYGVDVSGYAMNGRGPGARQVIAACPYTPVQSARLTKQPFVWFQKCEGGQNPVKRTPRRFSAASRSFAT